MNESWGGRGRGSSSEEEEKVPISLGGRLLLLPSFIHSSSCSSISISCFSFSHSQSFLSLEGEGRKKTKDTHRGVRLLKVVGYLQDAYFERIHAFWVKLALLLEDMRGEDREENHRNPSSESSSWWWWEPAVAAASSSHAHHQQHCRVSWVGGSDHHHHHHFQVSRSTHSCSLKLVDWCDTHLLSANPFMVSLIIIIIILSSSLPSGGGRERATHRQIFIGKWYRLHWCYTNGIIISPSCSFILCIHPSLTFIIYPFSSLPRVSSPTSSHPFWPIGCPLFFLVKLNLLYVQWMNALAFRVNDHLVDKKCPDTHIESRSITMMKLMLVVMLSLSRYDVEWVYAFDLMGKEQELSWLLTKRVVEDESKNHDRQATRTHTAHDDEGDARGLIRIWEDGWMDGVSERIPMDRREKNGPLSSLNWGGREAFGDGALIGGQKDQSNKQTRRKWGGGKHR